MDKTILLSPPTVAYSERTQISLSPSLRSIIDAQRILTKESLSEYIRQAVNLRLAQEEKRNTQRRQAAQIFIGSVKKSQHSEWRTKKDILAWQRKLRKEKV
ncbi:MAG: hypothetical protein ABH896_02660 [Candidatus Jacksonbacteria bacterium]